MKNWLTAEKPLYRFQEAGLDPDEMDLLQAMDGTETVRRIVDGSPISESDTYRFLYAMRCANLLELTAEKASVTTYIIGSTAPTPHLESVST